MGCTVGCKVLAHARELVLFKNKDFGWDRFEDSLIYDEELFAVQGTVNWDASVGEVAFSGVSVGANAAGLLCADTNIKTLKRAKNYDLLVELVLRKAATIDEAVEVVEEAIRRERYGWANLVVATAKEVAALEVSGRVVVARDPVSIARANHFILNPDYRIDYHNSPGTKSRFADASRLVPRAGRLEDFYAVCRWHRSLKRADSICNHGSIRTVYSYIFHYCAGRLTLHVAQGNPCRTSYRAIEIPLPPTPSERREVLAQYPSRRVKS